MLVTIGVVTVVLYLFVDASLAVFQGGLYFVLAPYIVFIGLVVGGTIGHSVFHNWQSLDSTRRTIAIGILLGVLLFVGSSLFRLIALW